MQDLCARKEQVSLDGFVTAQHLSSLHSLYACVARRLEEEQRTTRDLLAAVEAERDAAVSELKVCDTFRIAYVKCFLTVCT